MLTFLLILAILAAVSLGWLYFREVKRSSEYLERAQLAQQEKQIVAEFMHEMVLALGDGLNKEELFQRIVHASIVATRGLSACVFELTEKQTLRSLAVEGLFPPHRPIPEEVRRNLSSRARFIETVLKTEEFPITEGIAGEAARTKKTIRIENCATDSRVVKHHDSALQVTTAICAPIMFRDEVLGVLSVANSADGRPFTATDESVVQSLAEQAGIAIRNNEYLKLLAERKQIDVDLALARNIQLMLLPQSLPEIEGVDIDARYVSSHSVGGDLYDVIRLGERKIGVAIADVSGKGIPASIVMAICRTNLHRVAQIEDSPSKVLSAVNKAMVGDVKEDMYITVLYAVFDLDREELVYARAGHEHPLLCFTDEKRSVSVVEFPDSEGFPIGLVPEELFDDVLQEIRLPFKDSDVFVAFTDGVIEIANSQEKEFSNSRLADAVKANRAKNPHDINDAIIHSLESFSGKDRYDDDLTMVTVKRQSGR